MGCVRDILNAKEHKIQFISPKATVYEALEKMSEKDIGALVVFENKKKSWASFQKEIMLEKLSSIRRPQKKPS